MRAWLGERMIWVHVKAESVVALVCSIVPGVLQLQLILIYLKYLVEG